MKHYFFLLPWWATSTILFLVVKTANAAAPDESSFNELLATSTTHSKRMDISSYLRKKPTGTIYDVDGVANINMDQHPAIKSLMEASDELSRVIEDTESTRRGNTSIENDVHLLDKLTGAIAAFEDSFVTNENDLDLNLAELPNDFKNQLASLRSLLSKASKSLVDVNEFVKKVAPNKKPKPTRVDTSNESLSANNNVIPGSNQDIEGSDFKSISAKNESKPRKLLHEQEGGSGRRKSSRAEYDMRARGYHGFLAEDMKIDQVFHTPGGRGSQMYESYFSSDFNNYGFSSLDKSHYMPDFMDGGRRRLQSDGVCATPTESDLKAERCERLIQCASKYTMYDLFIYFFGDNLDEDTGEFDNEDIVRYFNEKDIQQKYADIQHILEFSNDTNKCDDLIRRFHRFDEMRNKWTGGSVTSICRGWGTTRKASLRAIYNFVRHRFIMEDWDGEEKFPVYLEHSEDDDWFTSRDSSFVGVFQVVGGSGSDYFKAMYVTHGDPADEVVGSQVPSDNLVGREFYQFICNTDYGSATWAKKDAICVDKKERNDGIMEIHSEDAEDDWELTIYDFAAFELVGSIYDDFIGCATKIQEILKSGPSLHAGRYVDLRYPWIGYNKECIDSRGRPVLSQSLHPSCSSWKYRHERSDKKIESFADYFSPDSTQGQGRQYVEEFIPLIENMSNLLFGNETSIGQVCSYADAMTSGIVDDLPGYCCLDSPGETKWWGEQYSCLYEYGEKKGKQRPQSQCRNRGPWWSGFNEASCNVNAGTWCLNPRPCETLTCVQDLRNKVKDDEKRKAFFEYLDQAPELVDPEDTRMCGDLREYLEYDRDYADDERICEELEYLQCRNDFSNLNENAESGFIGKPEDTAINTKVEIMKKGFAEDWKKINDGLEKAVLSAEYVKDNLEVIQRNACLPFVSAIAFTATPCVLAMYITENIATIVYYSLFTAKLLSLTLYWVIVEHEDYLTDREMQELNYRNIVLTANNGIATYKSVQQVRALLGDVPEDLNDFIEEDSGGRLLTEDSCSADDVCNDPLGSCSCEDKAFFCDCKPNYEFLKIQQMAGCDAFDSDGDGSIDNCEDTTPPRLVIRDSNIFLCDKSDAHKLCYSDETFKEYWHAEQFLLKQFNIGDDCASQKKLDISVQRMSATVCGETIYRLTPKQHYAECSYEEYPDFVNPLQGESKEITVRVDNEDPVVECGFLDHHEDNSDAHIDGKTLFHYGTPNATISELEISNFQYNVTDNCNDVDISIDVGLKSNEREQIDTAILIPYDLTNFVEQTDIYYSPTSCELGNTASPKCNKNIRNTGNSTKVRFYEITVTATDTAGRQGRDVCHIIVVPPCNTNATTSINVSPSISGGSSSPSSVPSDTGTSTSQPSAFSTTNNSSTLCKNENGTSSVNKELIKDIVSDQSSIRYHLASKRLKWGFEPSLTPGPVSPTPTISPVLSPSTTSSGDCTMIGQQMCVGDGFFDTCIYAADLSLTKDNSRQAVALGTKCCQFNNHVIQQHVAFDCPEA